MDIRMYLQEKKEIVDSALERYFPPLTEANDEGALPAILHKAIRHSLFSGGKRIRPILAIAAFEGMDGRGDGLLPFVCGLEMIHTYSLIHDDLPAMDNDDYRRGKPTCHKVFGEAIAILAGDGLLTEAFRLMTDPRGGGPVLELVHEVALAAGIFGMVGGQVVDIQSEGKAIDRATLEHLHTLKTGKMITVSIRVGARFGGAGGERLKALTEYGDRVGLAFQIADDILNVEGKAELLGKSVGSDFTKRKATFPSVVGLDESKRRAKELVGKAIDAISPFGREADPLRGIAEFIISREK